MPSTKALRQNQWCATFREDVEAYLATYVKSDTIQTVENIIRIGTTSQFTKARLIANSTKNGRWLNDDAECLDVYHDTRRIAFRSVIEKVMDSLQLNAMVYPSWNHPPARIDHFEEEYKGDNSQVISPHTGQPAFTVPMGFLQENSPVGLHLLGRMYDEPTLIKLAYSYDQGTTHRKPPMFTELGHLNK